MTNSWRRSSSTTRELVYLDRAGLSAVEAFVPAAAITPAPEGIGGGWETYNLDCIRGIDREPRPDRRGSDAAKRREPEDAMTLRLALGFGSVIVQMVGVLLTAYGLRQTWREVKREPDRFLDPAIGRARNVTSLLRRVLHKGQAQQVALTGRAALSLAGSSARVRVGYGHLPSTTKAAIAQLARRTEELTGCVQDVQDEASDNAARLTKHIEKLGQLIDEQISQLDWQSRRVAQGGVRWEALGLFFVAVGLLLQAVAMVI